MALRWFVDESALGLGKLLARTRDDVIYAGHPDLPEIPLGTIDVGWMPIVAARDWVPGGFGDQKPDHVSVR